MAYAIRNRKKFNPKNNQLRVVGDYLLQTYNFKNIPLQYLPMVEEYSNKVRKVKIKMNTEKKKLGIIAKDFSVYKVSARSSAG